MVDQQPHLAGGAVQPRDRQVWFAEGSAGATAASIGSDLP